VPLSPMPEAFRTASCTGPSERRISDPQLLKATTWPRQAKPEPRSGSKPELRSWSKAELRAGKIDPVLLELRKEVRLKAARKEVLKDPRCRLLLGLKPEEPGRPDQWVHKLPSLAQRRTAELKGKDKIRHASKEKVQETVASKKKVKKRTVTMTFQEESNLLPAASWEKVGPLCPSVQDALDRFYVNTGFIPDHEIKRMRVAFQRFCSEDNDLYRGQVHEVLTHLNYVPVSEDKATAIAKDTNEFSTLDFQDFCDFSERYMNYEREVIRVKIEEWTSREKEEDYEVDAVKECQGFLKSMGTVCLKAAVEETLVLGGLSGLECTKAEELLRFLAAFRAREGFTAEEITRIQQIFDACEAEPQPKTASEMRADRHIKASQLCTGLLKFAGLYCAEQLRELLDKMEESMELDKPPPISFFEFLVCCRRIRDMMLLAASEEFDNVDQDEDGVIEGEELREFCKPLGFTLSNAEWEEMLAEQDISPEDDIEFQGAWSFLQGVQQKNGFTQEEADELEEAFHRFSDTTGELQNLKVQELLVYMGFQSSVEEVQSMVRRVDFNGNKTMDKNEFLRLMRLQRETTLASYTAAYARSRLYARQNATPSEVTKILELAKLQPNVKILNQALELVKESGDYDEEQPSLSWEGFLKVADYCRKTIPVENRKYAHFDLQEISVLRKSFNSQDVDRNGWISIGSFLWLLSDTTMQVNTVNGRARMYEQMERARKHALEAGVNPTEVGNPQSPRLRFFPMIHFVHETVKNHTDAVFQREDEALKAVQFSQEEVAMFRELFGALARQREVEKEPEVLLPGRRLSAMQAQQVLSEAEEAIRQQKERELTLGAVIKRLTKVDRVPGTEIVKMVTLMGVKLSGPLRQELMDRTIHFSDQPDGALDFPGFLQLMQWMVGTNFGNINAAAENTVKMRGLMDKSGRLQPGLLSFGKFAHMEGVNVRARPRNLPSDIDLL